MTSKIAYFRVSTRDQSIDAQRTSLGGPFDREFFDEGVSGAIPAGQRPGFSSRLEYVREGDTLFVAAVDRLGRDAIDIQRTVRRLMDKDVAVEITGLGRISQGAGEIVLAVLAQVAQMERDRIRQRCEAGREVARHALRSTGQTHRGKVSLGRSALFSSKEVAKWRWENQASIAETARHFEISVSTVKRYCRENRNDHRSAA